VLDGDDADALHAELALREAADCPLWLARYPIATRRPAVLDPGAIAALPWPPTPRAWSAPAPFHQYQGDALMFPGFSSTVDITRFRGDDLGAFVREAWAR
jgi:hypothetical protein